MDFYNRNNVAPKIHHLKEQLQLQASANISSTSRSPLYGHALLRIIPPQEHRSRTFESYRENWRQNSRIEARTAQLNVPEAPMSIM